MMVASDIYDLVTLLWAIAVASASGVTTFWWLQQRKHVALVLAGNTDAVRSDNSGGWLDLYRGVTLASLFWLASSITMAQSPRWWVAIFPGADLFFGWVWYAGGGILGLAAWGSMRVLAQLGWHPVQFEIRRRGRAALEDTP